MARPLKVGIDYFSFDVFMDDKMKLIEAQFGLKGFAIVVKLWQKIYGGFGYYCEWTNDIELLFKRELNLSPNDNSVSDIIGACIRRGIFDGDLYAKYKILTSHGIQKRYFESVKRRWDVVVDKRYLLINLDYNKINGDNNLVTVCKNSIDVNNNTTNKSKVNKSKVNYNSSAPASYDIEEALERSRKLDPTNTKK